MNCRNHPTRTAINTCNQCGDWLCEVCTADVGGRIFCSPCLQKHWVNEGAAPPPPRPTPYYPPRSGPERGVSFGLLFFFTVFLPPGVNYMYEGLIKRGLFILSSFFLSIYLAAALSEPIFGFITAIMWITCAFDAFRIRKRLIAGENVPDSVDDILAFIKRYKTALILFFVIVLALNLLGAISSAIAISYLPYIGRIRPLVSNRVLPILILLGGIYLIVFSGKRSESSSTYIDHRHNDTEKK